MCSILSTIHQRKHDICLSDSGLFDRYNDLQLHLLHYERQDVVFFMDDRYVFKYICNFYLKDWVTNRGGETEKEIVCIR